MGLGPPSSPSSPGQASLCGWAARRHRQNMAEHMIKIKLQRRMNHYWRNLQTISKFPKKKTSHKLKTALSQRSNEGKKHNKTSNKDICRPGEGMHKAHVCMCSDFVQDERSTVTKSLQPTLRQLTCFIIRQHLDFQALLLGWRAFHRLLREHAGLVRNYS